MTAMFGSFFAIMLLTLGGVGGSHDAPSPKAAEVQRYAVAGANHLVFVNFAAVLPNSLALAETLAGLEMVKSSPELSRAASEGMSALKLGLAMIESKTGVNPIRDLHWAAGWATYPSEGDPHVLVAIGGKFPSDLISKLAGMMSLNVVQVHGRPTLRPPGERMVFALAPKGVFLVGTPTLIKTRLAQGWAAPRGKGAGRLLVELPRILKSRPHLAVASAPSATSRARFAKLLNAKDERVARRVLTAHDFFVLSLAAKGMRWTWDARDASGLEDAHMVSLAALDLLRALNHGGRGIARLAYAFAEDLLVDAPAEVREPVLRHRKELLELIMSMSGNGKFSSSVKIDKKNHAVTVSAKGKSLRQVLPAGGLVLGGALGFVVLARGQSAPDAKSDDSLRRAPSHRPSPPAEAPSGEGERGPTKMDVNPTPPPITPNDK